jgi:RsiW-degrading membrane proteinase PrsW (M82 family)
MTVDPLPEALKVRGAKDWRSILQAVMSLTAAAIALGQGIITILLGVFNTAMPGFMDTDPGMRITLGIVSGVLGLLLIPSGLSAIYRLRNQPTPHWLTFGLSQKPGLFTLALTLFPVVIIMGWLAARSEILSLILIPIAGVLGICIPILCLVSFGQHELEGGSDQRKWGLLGFSLTITTGIIVLVEVLAILAGLITVIVWLSFNVEMYDLVMDIQSRITQVGGDMDAIINILLPYLSKPAVIFWILIAVAVITPLIEEILKTLGVWLFVKRKLTPVEGYVAGLICGAGFALIEGLFNLAGAATPQDWVSLVIGRAGGSLLHIFTGGLIGWGLAETWHSGKFQKYLLAFLGALIIHGLWNALAVGSVLLPFILYPDETLIGMRSFLFYLPTIILGLAVLLLFVLFTLRLRKKYAMPVGETVITP